MVRLVVVAALLVALLQSGGKDLPGVTGVTRAPAVPDGTAAADCRLRRTPVRVRLSRRRYPHIADHVADVDQDFPRVLHLDRVGADENREESLRGVRTRPGYDRDEYPPAVSREGGKGADVRLVPSGENRSAGAAMGNRLRGRCDGQRFELVVRR